MLLLIKNTKTALKYQNGTLKKTVKMFFFKNQKTVSCMQLCHVPFVQFSGVKLFT